MQDGFIPPDRQDQIPDTGGADGEVVDVFGKAGTVGGGEGERVDLDSGPEGDARSMASEGGDADLDDTGRSGDDSGRRDDRGTRDARQRTDGPDADDDRTFSAKTRKRIARERALVNRERALREQVQQQLTDERTARQATDERLARLERAQTEVAANADVKALEAQIRDLEPRIAALIEAGNTIEAVKLQSKLGDLQSDLKLLKYDLKQKQAQAEATAAASRAKQATTVATDNTVTVDPAVAELANQFKTANRHWWNRTANKGAREDAVTIDAEILTEITAGELDFEPYADEHFEELAHRLHETYPHLVIQDLAGQAYVFEDTEGNDMNDNRGRGNGGNNARQNGRQGGRQESRAGAAPVRSMGQGGRRAPTKVEMARQGKVEIDESLRNTMRIFKQDPNDPVAKKYFARERARTILSGNYETDDRK